LSGRLKTDGFKMEHNLTFSIQDYLKKIYELTDDGQPASTTALAARLGIAPASVTGMVQKLAATKPPLLKYRKHQGVTLTGEGQRAALEVIRHHRLLEAWLVKTLGYSWTEVHGEAEKLEHVISEDFEKRIAAAMGNPDRDPHGEPIPTADLVMPEDESVSLSALKAGQKGIVSRVRAEDTDLLKHLEGLGLNIGVQLEVLDVSPYDQVARLRIRGRKEPAILGPVITARVFVRLSS
jgi:DtxR family transcriptional regulator, Mn-dependent transcriptional regulator